MSAEKTTNPCNKFQANIFNKSKCQNCFKSREVHLLTDDGLEQAKPVYGGWLCLAPEGTDFDNPAQRSRKWQRRFFILYENGHLSFALDELPSTLPQGTVDMRSYTWVGDAEPRTGQRNTLCIATPQQELFIRAESREMINGWCEQITAFPRKNKPSGSRKHKVDHDPSQEASPAKMATTGWCRQEAEPAGGRPGEPEAGLRKDAQPGGGLSGTATDMDARGPDQPSSGSRLQCHPATSRGRSSSAGTKIKPGVRGRGPAGASPNRQQPAAREDSGPSQTVMGLELGYPTATETKQGDLGDQSESRMGRNGARANKREMLTCGDAFVPQRRAKSLDRRTSESIMIPDLLNFKKGWMVKLEEEDQWRKYWFVLSADSLRYYKDSLAEEAFDLQGEIDLTKCYDVSEYQVLRNYGFQIHTQRGIFTLSAMTAGIRKNWIHALMKNVTCANAPDVASLPGLHIQKEALPKPDVTRDSSEERRRDESCKTSDQTEFKPLSESPSEVEIRRSGEPCSSENQESRRRRQQRRERYESILGLALSQEAVGDVDARGRTSGFQQSLVEKDDAEKMWRQVERTAFRVERAMPLFTETAAEEEAELRGLMESYRQGVEDLRSRLEESDCRRLELEAQLRTGRFPNQEICPTMDATPCPGTERDPPESQGTVLLNGRAQNLTEMYWETRGLLQQQNAVRHRMQEQLTTSLSPLEHQQPPGVQAPSIWLHDTDGNQQQLGYFHPDLPSTANTTAPSLILDNEEPPLRSDGERAESNIQTLMERAAYKQVSSSDTHINNTGEDYVQMPLNIFESLSDQDECVTPELAVFKMLSQEVELLRGQNKALHQHNQEMLNQLTEADREITRLKAHLGLLPEVERTSQARVAVLEMELNSRIRELLEARSLSASLERRLSEAESQASQLGTTAPLDVPGDAVESGVEVDATTAGCGGKEYLLRYFEATEAKLMDLERKLHQSEQSCSELQRRNVEVEEAVRTCGRRAVEAEAEVSRLSAELEEAKSREGQNIPSEENVLQMSERAASKAPGKLMEVIRRSEVRLVESQREEQESTWVSHLKWEGDEFWGAILNRIKADSSQATEDKLICVFLIEVAEHMLVERQLLLLAQHLLLETASCTSIGRANLVELDEDTCSSGTGNMAWAMPENQTWSEFTGTVDLNNQHFCKAKCVENDFTESREPKMYLLNYITSVCSSPSDQLKLRGHWLCKHYGSRHLWLHAVHTTATDARHWKLNEAQQQGQLTSSPACTDCTHLGNENGELRATVSLVKELEKASAASKPVSTNPQGQDQALRIWLQDIEAHLATLGDYDPEVPSTRSTPPPVSDHRVQLLPSESQSTPSNLGTDETTIHPSQGDREETGAGTDTLAVTPAEQELSISDGTQPMDRPEETGPSLQDSRESPDPEVNVEMSNHSGDVGLAEEEEGEEEEEEEVVRLTIRVKVLEEQLCHVAEELKAEHDGIMSSLRLQHKKDMERLKEACERGLASVEESQQRLLEGIQLHHQGELERLLTDRDQLLEEETAAAVTAIQSINRAYQLQLERHAEETQQSNISSDNTHLQETQQQQHREELEVLVQQVSLQRQETSLLGQALQAEQTALSRCQLENRALRARNQELSLLAAEGRLCSSSQRGPGGEVFQLEISLRVAESELQWLRQEVTGLREDMLHAHREHSLAVQQQTEFSTELSELRVRFQTDVDVLRENLRLAHRALEQTIL